MRRTPRQASPKKHQDLLSPQECEKQRGTLVYPSNGLKFCCSAGPRQDTPTGRHDKREKAQWRPHHKLSVEADAFTVAASSNFLLGGIALSGYTQTKPCRRSAFSDCVAVLPSMDGDPPCTSQVDRQLATRKAREQ